MTMVMQAEYVLSPSFLEPARNAFHLAGRARRRYFDALERADADASVRVIVVTGAGSQFCVGADMDLLSVIGTEGASKVEVPARSTDQIQALEIKKPIKRCDERYIVITHGTDTMRETAHALTGIQNKVIVITGAMQPAAFTHSDGVFNVGSAIAAVQLASPGVHISMNGRLFDPRKVRKNLDTSCYEDVD
jgi:L-asparaginase